MSIDVKNRLIQWPSLLTKISKLDKQRLEWKIGSKLIVPAVGLISKLWTDCMNKTKVHNHLVLLEALNKNYKNRTKRPLITISNHCSCLDDPLMWGALIPLKWQFNSDRHRWSAAAQEICFTNSVYSLFFSLGKTFPIIRGSGIYQKSMDYALELLKDGQWLHIFPEGKVIDSISDLPSLTTRLDTHLNISDDIDIKHKPSYELKWGLARLILDHVFGDDTCADLEVLPIYHLGMEDILPTREPYIPRINKKATFYVRDDGPIYFDRKFLSTLINDITSLSSREKRVRIMQFFENEMNLLKVKAFKLHHNLENSESEKQ